MDEELGYYAPWDGWPIEACGPEYWLWLEEAEPGGWRDRPLYGNPFASDDWDEAA